MQCHKSVLFAMSIKNPCCQAKTTQSFSHLWTFPLVIIDTCCCVTWRRTRRSDRTSASCANAASRLSPVYRTMWTCTTASSRTSANIATVHSQLLVGYYYSSNFLYSILSRHLGTGVSLPRGGPQFPVGHIHRLT